MSAHSSYILVLAIALAQVSRAALVSFGLDPNVALVTYTLFFLWPGYLLHVKSRSRDLAAVLLQSSRATTYGVSFLFLIPLNALVVTAANPSTILLTPMVGLGLAAVIGVSLKRTYKETAFFSKEELHEYSSMIMNAGTACIWVTVAIGYFNLILTHGLLDTPLGLVTVASVVAVNAGVSLWSEHKSARNLNHLFSALRQSGWTKKVETARKIAYRKDRRSRRD